MKKTLLICCFGLLFVTKLEAQSIIKKVVTDLASDAYLGRKVGTVENQQTVHYLEKMFKDLKFTPCIGDEFAVPFTYQNKTEYNVCAIKKGKTDEIVGFGAHFDHIGTSNKVAKDSIFNGADDNASGVGMMMALAEKFSKTKTEKTLMFVGFNAEEVGLIGSKELVENKDFQVFLPKLNAMLVFEMLGTVSKFGQNKVYMTGDQYSNLRTVLNEYAPKTFEIVEDPYQKYNLYQRSDNAPFAIKGIVSHAFSTVDMATATHYHQPNDEVEIIDFTNMNLLADSFYQTISNWLKAENRPQLMNIKSTTNNGK